MRYLFFTVQLTITIKIIGLVPFVAEVCCSSSQGWEKGQYRVGVGRGQVSFVQQNDLCEFRVTFAQGVPPGVGGLAWGGVGLGVIVICWKEILTIYFNRNNTQCRTITGVILRSPVQPSP